MIFLNTAFSRLLVCVLRTEVMGVLKRDKMLQTKPAAPKHGHHKEAGDTGGTGGAGGGGSCVGGTGVMGKCTIALHWLHWMDTCHQ